MMEVMSFQQGLLDNLPALRAFARSLSKNVDTADDLVQETMMKAWEKQALFEPGSNLRAWLFTILRNTFYGKLRKYSWEVEDPDGVFVGNLTEEPRQDSQLVFRDFLRAFSSLTAEHREVLMLIGASGLSYQEAAEVCGCAVGTIKSRVSRARKLLSAYDAPPTEKPAEVGA